MRVANAIAVKRFAVVGMPVAHSRSPEIFAALSAQSGIPLHYERIAIEPSAFDATVAAAHGVYDGWNVTAPHKERALAAADAVSADARAVGAANVLTFRDGAIRADNTDVGGVTALLRAHGADPAGRTVTVLGAGGAARAALLALAQLGAAQIVVANRTAERAHALVAALRDATGATQLAVGEPAAGSALVVNATSDGGAVAAAVAACAPAGWCVDLQYKPTLTPFVQAARAGGRNAANGTIMLVAQAIATFRLWYGDGIAFDEIAATDHLTRLVEST